MSSGMLRCVYGVQCVEDPYRGTLSLEPIPCASYTSPYYTTYIGVCCLWSPFLAHHIPPHTILPISVYGVSNVDRVQCKLRLIDEAIL